MLTVSFEAKELIAADDRYPSDQPLRLLVSRDESSIELRPTVRDPDDLSFSHVGRTLLLVQADLAERLDGKALDVAPTKDGPALTLRDRGPAIPAIH